MQFYGSRQLVVDEGLELFHEPDNKYDDNAIVIKNENGRTLAYLEKSAAKQVAVVIRQKLVKGKIAANAKYEAEVRSRKGPQQRIAVGFHCDPSCADKIKDIFSLRSSISDIILK